MGEIQLLKFRYVAFVVQQRISYFLSLLPVVLTLGGFLADSSPVTLVGLTTRRPTAFPPLYRQAVAG